ncbi:DUF3180 domain-containing protein [Humidisolicoccus flavus]|uniref:DUF3180 domain-containing protein n=1 Tax=Humidisolicoccus flavus TaxID=3111414 RepID=UPI003252D6BA
MTRTSPWPLIGSVVVAGILGFAFEQMLSGSGRTVYVPPLAMSIALLAVAALSLGIAWPVRQQSRGKNRRRVHYRQAMNALVLAKASSIVGSLFLGAAGGFVLYFSTRVVVPGEPLTLSIVAAAASLVLIVAGLIAESWCVVPPDDENTAQGKASPGNAEPAAG